MFTFWSLTTAFTPVLSALDLWHQISLGDVQSNYLLTTAENELGVVVAHSESGDSFFSQRGFLVVPCVNTRWCQSFYPENKGCCCTCHCSPLYDVFAVLSVANQVPRWFPSAGVRCSAHGLTPKSSVKSPECSRSTCRPESPESSFLHLEHTASPPPPPKLCLQMFSECWTCLSPGFMSLVFQLHII